MTLLAVPQADLSGKGLVGHSPNWFFFGPLHTSTGKKNALEVPQSSLRRQVVFRARQQRSGDQVQFISPGFISGWPH